MKLLYGSCITLLFAIDSHNKYTKGLDKQSLHPPKRLIKEYQGFTIKLGQSQKLYTGLALTSSKKFKPRRNLHHNIAYTNCVPPLPELEVSLI